MHEAVAPLQVGLNVAGGFGIVGALFAAGNLIGRQGRKARRIRVGRATAGSHTGAAKKRDVSLTEVPHIGRAALIGALIGGVGVAVPAIIALLLLGGGATSVLAGAHFGFFGGMGFGGMIGAAIQADRSQRLRPGGFDHDRNASNQRQSTRRAA